MFHLDNETGVPVMPNLPAVQSNDPKWFTEGGNGIPPSWPGAPWFNITQAELLNVLAAANIQPLKSDLSQVAKAIKKLISDGNEGFLKIPNNLSEIRVAGAAAMASAVGNIGALSATGTAVAATKLATARKIGGVDFDGTKDITLPFINTTDPNVQLVGNLAVQGRGDIVGDVRGGRLISKSDLVAGEGRAEGHATLTVDGNIHGTLWGTTLYNFITEPLIGIPIPYPLPSVPAGYLKCNGAAFSTTTYPRLALKYPSGVLPDMRGDVIRAWDDGRGVDSGRALLSEQGFAIQNITGSLRVASSFADPGTAATGAFTVAASGVVGEGYQAGGTSPLFTFNAANVVATATETRMRNIAFNYIVRAL